jgi:hypothetical protein
MRTHGKMSTYQGDPRAGLPGCRCDECKAANRKRSKSRRAKRSPEKYEYELARQRRYEKAKRERLGEERSRADGGD